MGLRGILRVAFVEEGAIGSQRFIRPYMWLVITLGAIVSAYSLTQVSFSQLDLRFALLAGTTIILSARFCVPIPRTTGQISVSDTFIFLTMLLYGGHVAVLLAAGELFSASHYGDKRMSMGTSIFNAAMMALSTFITVCTLQLLFGDIVMLPQGEFSVTFMIALCVMGLVQYIANSGLAAIHTACKNNENIWTMWRKKYLWTSITYFAGASAAGLIVKLTGGGAGIYAFFATFPIIAIVYFTYRTYLENIDAMAAAAEAAKAEAEAAKAKAAAEAKAEAEAAKAEAEAAKAKAAAEQAEQARRHVEELNHYIAEQERIREQYSQIEKLSALGELASGVAHDFNNTLAGILGRAQLLLSTSDPEKIESGLRIIIKTAKDGAKTIKRIQDFARQRRDHDFAPVSVGQLLLDVSEITRPRWKDYAEASNVHIDLQIEICTNALVMGDESELREVLVNMVFNAIDAMPDGGKLTLRTEEVGGGINIVISDTGAGMTPEVRSRIFDPFFTTKGKAGLGLGLAVSYGIIRRHEGTVEVESEVSKGTTFRIRLPLAQESARPQAPTGELHVEMPGAARERGGTHLLVVDDEEHVRELLRDILEREGCRVTTAEHGSEALALFDRIKFDAVFADVGMPGMSGWELSRAIRERHRSIPLVVITGWGEAVGSDEQRAAGVDWVVAKPFTIDQIIEIAREVSVRQERERANVTNIAAA